MFPLSQGYTQFTHQNRNGEDESGLIVLTGTVIRDCDGKLRHIPEELCTSFITIKINNREVNKEWEEGKGKLNISVLFMQNSGVLVFSASKCPQNGMSYEGCTAL